MHGVVRAVQKPVLSPVYGQKHDRIHMRVTKTLIGAIDVVLSCSPQINFAEDAWVFTARITNRNRYTRWAAELLPPAQSNKTYIAAFDVLLSWPSQINLAEDA